MKNCFAIFLVSTLALAQTVEESFTRDPGPLDLVRGEGHEQAILQALAGDALVGLDQAGRPVPRLARNWTPLPGGWRFLLRPARFADGHPVRAEDVVWTFRAIQTEAEASPSKKALLQDLTVTGTGPRVEVRSRRPPERLLLELARIPIARQGNPALGSGPYRMTRRGNEWWFEARDHFLRPRIPTFRFRLVGEPEAILHWLRKGWLSIGVPPPRLGSGPPPTHREIVQPVHAQLVVWCRGGNGPLHGLERWRRDAFPPTLLGRSAVASRGLWPESLGFPALALDGATGELRGQRWEILHVAGDAFVIQVLLALRERARREGVTLDLRPVEPALLHARLRAGDFHLACALALFDPHPWSVLEYLEPGGPMNFTHWTHPDFPALRARLTDARSGAWSALQRAWAGTAGALPLLDYRSVVWVDRRLEVQSSPLGLYLSTPGPAGWTWTP